MIQQSLGLDQKCFQVFEMDEQAYNIAEYLSAAIGSTLYKK